MTAQDQQSHAELLPCPFCGGKPHVRPSQDADGCFWAWVQCGQCGARTQGDWRSSCTGACPAFYEGVREDWNQRALPPNSSVSNAEIGAFPEGVDPVAWTLTETLDKRETTTTARLWFSDPVNCMWTGLYTAAQVLAMGRVPPGWTDDQMVRFAWMCINPGLRGDSIAERLALFRDHEALRGIAAPRPPAAQAAMGIPISALGKCWCTTCRPITLEDARFVVCPDCGNKRCPKATDHREWQCSGSNEPGQVGVRAAAAPSSGKGARA